MFRGAVVFLNTTAPHWGGHTHWRSPMIKRTCAAKCTLPNEWNERFLSMLPQIERTVRYGLRNVSRHSREDAVCECIAHAYCGFISLAERGKIDLAYGTVLARYALKRLRDGRQVGSRLNSRDVMCPCAQQRHGFSVLPIPDQCGGDWEALVLENKHSGPAEVVAVRLDFKEWLARLVPTMRKVVMFLAEGRRTSEAARRFGLSAARISQLRKQLAISWNQFQADEPSMAV